MSVVVGFYRVCVIDAILPHSPADYVRRPTVPAESPTLGLGHLQFEALLTAARRTTSSDDATVEPGTVEAAIFHGASQRAMNASTPGAADPCT